MKFLNEGFDHVEFVVGDIAKHVAMWSKMGFEKIADVNSPSKHVHQIWTIRRVRRIKSAAVSRFYAYTIQQEKSVLTTLFLISRSFK